jgi:phosphopantetheinyl transferase
VVPTSNWYSASGGVFAGVAVVMQVVESQTLILYHTDLRGQWHAPAARSLARGLPYLKRLATGAENERGRASLAGIALALRVLTDLMGRAVSVGELSFAAGEKPRLKSAGPDFSISHSGPWVGCAALGDAQVGLDIEVGDGERTARWVAREAALKACGAGLRALGELRLHADGASCRGARWYAHALSVFPGAAACVMASRRVPGIKAHAVPLGELFAP